ncbi:MAG: hypothetical protein PWP57_1311 [Candidatus Atribacteria bacterium]|nr:hypothetical protein [Candidatus Atribacteria bacterium]
MIKKVGIYFFLPLLWEGISSSFLVYLWFPLRHLWIFSFLLISLFWKERENGSDILLILILGVTLDFLFFPPWGTYLFILSSLALFTYCWVRFFSTTSISLLAVFFCFPFVELVLVKVVAILEGTTLPFFPLLGAKLLSIPLNIFLFYYWQKKEAS